MKVESHDPVQSGRGDISLSDIADRFRETKTPDFPIYILMKCIDEPGIISAIRR